MTPLPSLPTLGNSRFSWPRALVLLVLALGVAYFTLRDPAVVRAVKDEVGMRKVEAYAADIRYAAAESGVDPLLIAAVMYAESSGKKGAVSSAGALGLMQLAIGSAEDAALKLKLPKPTRDDLLNDPSLNIRLGARHLAWLIEHEEGNLERVLAAYNAGRTKVRRWVNAAGGWEAWRNERVDSGESQIMTYVFKILDAQRAFEERGKILAP